MKTREVFGMDGKISHSANRIWKCFLFSSHLHTFWIAEFECEIFRCSNFSLISVDVHVCLAHVPKHSQRKQKKSHKITRSQMEFSFLIKNIPKQFVCEFEFTASQLSLLISHPALHPWGFHSLLQFHTPTPSSTAIFTLLQRSVREWNSWKNSDKKK